MAQVQAANTTAQLCELATQIKEGSQRADHENAVAQKAWDNFMSDIANGKTRKQGADNNSNLNPFTRILSFVKKLWYSLMLHKKKNDHNDADWDDLHKAFSFNTGRNAFVRVFTSHNIEYGMMNLEFSISFMEKVCPAENEEEVISLIIEGTRPFLHMRDDTSMEKLKQIAMFLTYHIPRDQRLLWEKDLIKRSLPFLKNMEAALEFVNDTLQTASAKNGFLAAFFCTSFPVPDGSSRFAEWKKLRFELQKDCEASQLGGEKGSDDIANRKMQDHFWAHLLPSGGALSEFIEGKPLSFLHPLAIFATDHATSLDIITERGRISTGEQVITAVLPQIKNAEDAVQFSEMFGMVQLRHQFLSEYVSRRESISEAEVWRVRDGIVCKEFGGMDIVHAVHQKAQDSGWSLDIDLFQQPTINAVKVDLVDGKPVCAPFYLVDGPESFRQILQRAKCENSLDKLHFNGKHSLQDVLNDPEGIGFPLESLDVLREFVGPQPAV